MSTSSIARGSAARDPRGGPPGRPTNLAIETPSPGVRLIRVAGVLNREGSAHLLRLVDSQLALARSGRRALLAVIIDMASVEALERGVPQTLGHVRFACDRLGVEVVLAGCLGPPISTSLAARGLLRAFRVVPTVDAALDALALRDDGARPGGASESEHGVSRDD